MSATATTISVPFPSRNRNYPEGRARTDPDSSVIIDGEVRAFDSVLCLIEPGAGAGEKLPREWGIFSQWQASALPRLVDVADSATTMSANPSPLWLRDLTSRIKRFSSLRENWDSYRAKRISQSAIQRASGVALLLADVVAHEGAILTDAPFVAPLSSGGILFEVKNRNRELHVEIEPAPSSKYQVYRLGNEFSDDSSEDEAPVSEYGLPEVFSWLVEGR